MHFIKRTGIMAVFVSKIKTRPDRIGPEQTGSNRNIFFNETRPNRNDRWFELGPDRTKI